MRVSSALEVGTVSGIFTRVLLVSSVPMDLFSIPQVWVNQYNMFEQQCFVWRKEAIWYRYVFLDIPVFFPQALAIA